MNKIATVYCIVWNEELRLPYFIKHYRHRFPDCRIVVFDNQSTDSTAKIALDNDCIVVSYDTNNKLDDETLQKNKNHCWKSVWDCVHHPWDYWSDWTWTAENEQAYLDQYPDIKKAIEQKQINCGMTHFFTFGVHEGRVVPNRTRKSEWGCKSEWCIVVDCDEFLDVDEKMLNDAEFNIINSTIYDMYGENNNPDDMLYGVPNYGTKTLCWKAKDINEINYTCGAHSCTPIPNPGKAITYNIDPIYTYHFKWISFQYVMDKYRALSARNEENYRRGFAVQVHFPEHQQRAYYDHLNKNKVQARQSPTIVRNEQKKIVVKHFYHSIDGWSGDHQLGVITVLRQNILYALPPVSHLKIAEVGVWRGRTTAMWTTELLNNNYTFEYHGIDLFPDNYISVPGQPGHGSTSKDIVMRNLEPVLNKINSDDPVKSRINLVKSESSQAASMYPDKYFDAVYIDADHQYNSVMNDIKAWLPKVKSGGYLCGDDYGWPGVKGAQWMNV